MDIVQTGSIIVAILGTPVIGKLIDAYTNRSSAERVDCARLNSELLQRVEKLEARLHAESTAREAAQKALADLTVEYRVLLIRFEQLEKSRGYREVSEQA